MILYIHPTVDRERFVEIGEGTKIWHYCHLREGATIGAHCVLGRNVYVEAGSYIGDGVHIQNNVNVYNGVKLEDGVFVGPGVVFTNDKYPRAGNKDWEVVPTIVKSGASIGAGAVIVCGVTIGALAMVGAGAVVRRDVAPGETYLEYGRSHE